MSHVIEKNARIWHHVGITWHVIMTPISSCPDMNRDWNKVPFLNWISPIEPFSSFRHQIIFQRDIQRTDRPNLMQTLNSEKGVKIDPLKRLSVM